MELDRKKIIDCLFSEAEENSVELDHGRVEIYTEPANTFSCSMTWELYNRANTVTDVIFLMGIQDYFKNYFKENASKRIANKLILEMKDGKVETITPTWDQTIADEFYNNLPVKKRSTHVGWYDLNS